jgi:hypothetical protein
MYDKYHDAISFWMRKGHTNNLQGMRGRLGSYVLIRRAVGFWIDVGTGDRCPDSELKSEISFLTPRTMIPALAI